MAGESRCIVCGHAEPRHSYDCTWRPGSRRIPRTRAIAPPVTVTDPDGTKRTYTPLRRWTDRDLARASQRRNRDVSVRRVGQEVDHGRNGSNGLVAANRAGGGLVHLTGEVGGDIATVASCCGHGERPGRISLDGGRELLILPSLNAADVLLSGGAS